MSYSPGGAGWGEGGVGVPAYTAAPATQTPISSRRYGWMDGWMEWDTAVRFVTASQYSPDTMQNIWHVCLKIDPI